MNRLLFLNEKKIELADEEIKVFFLNNPKENNFYFKAIETDPFDIFYIYDYDVFKLSQNLNNKNLKLTYDSFLLVETEGSNMKVALIPP